ncbi:MAG: AtpZ/AtpI family protein [Bacteroidales bacterium]|jgi:predicted MFS family arabinose efflux permease|nr:AtpZ/AtpI family protein [Bacteroidales bacterium]MCK9448386.1 AtpZ/AtpI family protein [Bacteroidales bacterium]MDD3700790.1 AtpZ/AtpI family protein [Bacteroidales bacterium]MDY0370399.1 AtpZ/AtpI family protein [Bacteroidales bacterium]
MKEKKHDKSSKIGQSLQTYAKYSSLAFQMLGIVLGGVLGGRWLDKKIGWDYPIMTLILSILSVSLAVYYAIKDFLRKPKP